MSTEQFDRLLELLGEVGSRAYQVAYRQVIVDSIAWFVLSVVFIVVGIYLVGRFKQNAKTDEYNEPEWTVASWITKAMIFILVLVAFSQIVHLLNPHWYVLRLLSSLVIGD